MNDSDYKTLVESAYDGRVVVGVDRAFARKLYTDVATSAIEEATGEAPYVEKLVVWFAFVAAPVAMLGSTVAAAFAFGWWALVIIPAALVWWMFNKSMSVRGGSPIWFLTLLVVAAVGVHFVKLLPSPWMSGFLALFALAMWCDRLLYWASTFFLRALVLRNRQALEAFADGRTSRPFVIAPIEP